MRNGWIAAIAGILTSIAVLPAAAGETAASAAVSATVRKLTKPISGTLDNLFEVMSTGKGFVVTWARSKGSVPPFSLFAQRFDEAGKAVGKPSRIGSPGTVGDHVEMAQTGPDGAVLAWLGNSAGKATFTVGKLKLSTMKITGIKSIGPSDDHIHDIARLSNGNIAAVTAQIDPLPLPGRYRNSLKVLSPALGTVKDWQSVHGNGFPLDSWAYIDQTVVALKTGGLVAYRDHVTNKVVGRLFSNGGALGKTIAISTTPFAAFSVMDIAYLEVKAAKLTTGAAAVCWTLPAATSGRYDVRCRVVSATGAPLGKDFPVSASSDGRQAAPEVVALPAGAFAVTWVDYGAIFPAAVKVRAFKANGTPLYAERIGNDLSKTVSGDALQTEAAVLKDGSIVNVIDQEAFVTGLRVGGIANPAKP